MQSWLYYSIELEKAQSLGLRDFEISHIKCPDCLVRLPVEHFNDHSCPGNGPVAYHGLHPHGLTIDLKPVKPKEKPGYQARAVRALLRKNPELSIRELCEQTGFPKTSVSRARTQFLWNIRRYE